MEHLCIWHTTEIFGFHLPFSDDGENGGGDDDDDADDNNSFNLNNKHLLHIHYMSISTTQWWVLLL